MEQWVQNLGNRLKFKVKLQKVKIISNKYRKSGSKTKSLTLKVNKMVSYSKKC